jgi:CheY-like chemotaxis protein
MTLETKHCLCCGEDVPYNRIAREGNTELTCVYCGFVLDVKEEEPSKISDCIMIADDIPFIRELLKGMLLKKELARTVIASENGQEFVVAFNKRLAENLPVDMAILDLEMPVMDGVTAARVMRSIEEKYRLARTPILFFSSLKCDDALKKQLAVFAPASYVNKGASTDPAHLVERIDQLVTHLFSRRSTPKS